MKRFIKRVFIVLVVLGFAGGAAAWYLQRGNGQTISYRTGQVTRGSLLISIDATGTVEPEEVIDVGSQIAGQILSFGRGVNGKPVDYGSSIDEGTVLARIDDSLYAAAAAEAEAQVQSAKATMQRAQADLEQIKAKFNQTERDWQRAQKLGPSEALSQASYDAYKSTYETARANIAVGEAAIWQAKAGIAQADAVLRRAQRNLSYCTIKSPVKGVIIDRRVNIGQTVVASLNAPSLFLIAKDLTRIQVWVAVNEVDIGKIHPGLPVSFTVDAFPNEAFKGEVGKVRLNASMTQNVVTYTVEIITDNSNGRLLPYLTANVQFELDSIENTLLVPNAALRWIPSVEQVAPEYRDKFEKVAAAVRERAKTGQPASRVAPAGGAAGGSSGRGVVWVPQDQYVRPIRVTTKLSDSAQTAVEGEELTEGLQVVTGQTTQAGSQSATSNPFTPQFGRSSRSSGSK